MINIDSKTSPALRFTIFVLAFIICISLGYLLGIKDEQIKTIGALFGSLASAIGAFIAYLLLKLIFKVKGERNLWGYMVGGLTLFVGIASFVLLTLFIWGNDFTMNLSLGVFLLSGLIWVVIMIFGGLEAPSFLAMLLGAALGGLGYAFAITTIPGLMDQFFMDTDSLSENLMMIRLVYGILGAFTGAIGATIARASSFGLKDPYEVKEI